MARFARFYLVRLQLNGGVRQHDDLTGDGLLVGVGPCFPQSNSAPMLPAGALAALLQHPCVGPAR